MAQSAGSIFLSLQVANAGQFRNSVNSVASSAGSSAGFSFSKLFNAAMLAAIPIGIIAAIRKAMKSSAVELASDLQEVQNVVNKSFGSMKQSAEDFAKSAMDSFGLTELQAKRYSSTYMSMASAMGISTESAAKMSINLTKLSADVASFYNLTNDEAYEKFKGVFSGETEPLKALGIVMTQANLEAYALKEGITKSYKEMSEAEKVALRYKFIMNQLSLAQGDFASTADGWANSMKTLQNQWDAFKTKVGNGMMKVFTPLLQLLNACVDKLSELMDILYSKLGWDFGEAEEATTELMSVNTGVAESASEIGAAYTDAAEEAKKAIEGLAGFDQINKLTSSSSSDEKSSSDYAEGGGEFSFNPFGDEYTIETEKAVNPMTAVVDKALNKLKELWDKYGTKAVAIIKGVYEFFKPYGERMVEIVKKLKATFDEWWAVNGEEFVANLKKCWEIIKDIAAMLIDNFLDWLERTGPDALTAILDIIKKIVQLMPYILETLKPILWALQEIGLFLLDVIVYTLGAIPELIDTIAVTLAILATTIYAMIESLWNTISDIFEAFWTGFMWIMTELPSILADVLINIVQFLVQFFADIVKCIGETFEEIGKFFVYLWDSICSFFSDAGQAVSDFWNGFLEAAKAPINGIISLINMMIDGLNTIQFDIPDWLGGGSFGINIAHIPMLAEGGVITAPTLAMVGEGSQNEAVVPLDDFKRDIAAIVASAVANTMAQMANNNDNNSGNTEIIVNVGDEKLCDKIIKNINRRSRNNGKCVINT